MPHWKSRNGVEGTTDIQHHALYCTGQSWRYASSMACATSIHTALACNALGQDGHERMKRIRCMASTPHPIQQRKHCDGAITINTSISLILVEGCHETTCQLAWPWSASFYCIKEICERLWKNLGKVCKVTSPLLEDIMIGAKTLLLTNDVTWLDSITISDPKVISVRMQKTTRLSINC